MVFILDGNPDHAAHVLRKEVFFKIRFASAFNLKNISENFAFSQPFVADAHMVKRTGGVNFFEKLG